MYPESRKRTGKGFPLAEIIENSRENWQHDKKRPASEIEVSDSRRGRFSSYAGDQGCWVGPENRNGARMRPAVAEKTENEKIATGWEEASVSKVNLSFLSNHRPLSSPVSCFRTDSTPFNTAEGRTHSAARSWVGDFECGSPLLHCAGEPYFFENLDNRWPLSISVSWFWFEIIWLNSHIVLEYSAALFSAARFESGFPMRWFNREYLE